MDLNNLIFLLDTLRAVKEVLLTVPDARGDQEMYVLDIVTQAIESLEEAIND